MFRLYCYLDWLAETDDLIRARRWLRRHLRTCPRGPLRGRPRWAVVDIAGLPDLIWVPALLEDVPTGHKVVGPRSLLPAWVDAGSKLGAAASARRAAIAAGPDRAAAV